MCTVTYLPLNNGYILTSNRDEWNIRPKACLPNKHVINGYQITFPKDPHRGGTWIAMSDDYTLCLLNGAFVKHQTNPPYKLSRGIMLLDFYKFLSIDLFSNTYDFNGIENFTLLIKSNITEEFEEFEELRWDGLILHRKQLNASENYIWSSCTLYSDEIIQQRKVWFEKWLLNHLNYKQKDIIHFHQFAGNGDLNNDILMQRDSGIKTQSITSILKNNEILELSYLDIK